MNFYPMPPNEKERLSELFRYKILDSPAESEFDDVAEIVTKTFDVPVAMISFVDSARQWVKSKVGFEVCNVNRAESVCSHTILQNGVMEVQDLQKDERFHFFPGVISLPYFRFYAGVPLVTQKGYNIGVLCILDNKVRSLSPEDHCVLTAFARNIVSQLEVRLQNLELEARNDRQKRITAALSHDLRSPLANVKMLLDLHEDCSDVIDENDSREMNRMLKDHVENTMDILNNMIQWGKLQMSDGCANSTFNLRKLADEALNEVYNLNSAKFNTLVNAVSDDVYITAEQTGLRFILRNLLSNAGKFTQNGTITISYAEKKGKKTLCVRDTGVGMTPETAARINRHEKVNHTNGTQNEPGHGFGLNLVQEYLAKQNKEMLFQSILGIGTIVSITL